MFHLQKSSCATVFLAHSPARHQPSAFDDDDDDDDSSSSSSSSSNNSNSNNVSTNEGGGASSSSSSSMASQLRAAKRPRPPVVAEVALKKLEIPAGASQQQLRRTVADFHSEARMLRSVGHHPCIASMLGATDVPLGLVMEFYQGAPPAA